MAATDAKSILAASSCDACFASNNYSANLLIIGLLRIIALAENPMAATDAKTLLANSQCDAECGMQFPLIIIGLLRIIAQGGGGGATCVTGGNSPPTGSPPCTYSVWIQGPGPNFGVWFADGTGWSAVAAIAQGP